LVSTSTHNIEISVKVTYWAGHSIPRENHYFFIYYITIKNKSDYSVQLLKRHWDIFDSVGIKREVDGDGVIGETPVIEPGEEFQYNSGCNLQSDMGYMKGHYTIQRLFDNNEMIVNIPQFDMIVPGKMN
jgi:ApaG protein